MDTIQRRRWPLGTATSLTKEERPVQPASTHHYDGQPPRVARDSIDGS
jgi:hypothetical protein